MTAGKRSFGFISGINCCPINGRAGKPVAVAYIDDRAICYHGDVETTCALVDTMASRSLKKDQGEKLKEDGK